VNITVFDSPVALADYAADLITEFIAAEPTPVLGLATGGAMTPIYAELINRYNRGLVSFSRTTGFLLD
jgi:glucosamine-6-phosphate deaminase